MSNQIIVEGNAAATPELRHTGTGKAVVNVNIHVLVADVLERRRFGMSAGGVVGVCCGAALRWARTVVAARGFR